MSFGAWQAKLAASPAASVVKDAAAARLADVEVARARVREVIAEGEARVAAAQAKVEAAKGKPGKRGDGRRERVARATAEILAVIADAGKKVREAAEAADAAEDARRAANAATAGRDAAAQVADFYQAAHEAEQRALEAGRAERAAPGDKRLAWRGSIARRLAYLAALSAVQRGGLST